MEKTIETSINSHIQTIQELHQKKQAIKETAETIINCLSTGNKVLVCGNGGSASDSQHLAAELVGRFKQKERPPLAAIALTTDTSILTAVGNDFGFDEVFSKQIQALGKENDVLIVISTSGNSANLIKAVTSAKNLNIKSIGLLGKNGGKLAGKVDLPLVIRSGNTARIQEAHTLVLHTICELIEEKTGKN